MVKVRHRRPISNSLSISRARSAADLPTADKRRDTEYLRSIRSAVFLASNSNCSKPSLALRQASLANLSMSLRRKARTVAARRKRIGRLWMRVGTGGYHDRAVAIITPIRLVG